MLQVAPPSPPPIDPAQIVAWITQHKWVPLIALAVGFFVRLLKEDSWIENGAPSWMRPYLALVFSILITYSMAVVGGLPWQQALQQALMAFALAILGHQTIVEKMRGGKEVPVGFLVRRKPANDVAPDDDDHDDPPSPITKEAA